MKKIIFDVDNTLLMHKEKYLNYYVQGLKEMGYEASFEQAKKIYSTIGEYEHVCSRYDKEEMISFVNSHLGTNYDIKLLDVFNNYIGKYWYEIEDEVVEVVEYLSKKYELYVLTNWFGSVAAKRLENAGILKYFKEVVGGDKVGAKPNRDCFLYFAKDCDISECLMIGDSPKTDYVGATSVGMPVILYDYKNIYDSDEYRKINKFEELKEIL